MKIETVEFENFRNFKGKNRIVFNTDKAVTIIYGKNGDGKTTLHQLFQWIFYNKVHFNKTASDRMFNHEYESEMDYEQIFSVKGSIDFQNNNEHYSLNREWKFQKGLTDSKKLKEELTIYKLVNDNWDKLHDPEAIIEELLPSGLSEYFFFDGESMIADLSVKGKESANKLKEALFTIFDLSVYEQALSHIGSLELKTTILGQLYLSKADVSSDVQVMVAKTNISNAQNKISQLEDSKKEFTAQKAAKSKLIQELSERIGKAKSTEDYERERKYLKKQREVFLGNENIAYTRFGEAVVATFPRMMVSKRIEEAKKILRLKADNNTLIPGVNKRLIDALTNGTHCLCGNKLTSVEIEKLEKYLELLPPISYQQTYDDFNREARRWGEKYDRENVEEQILAVLNNRNQAALCDEKIQKLDKEVKQNNDLQKMIVNRKKAEEYIISIDENLSRIENELTTLRLYRKQQMKRFDDLTAKTEQNIKINQKMEIINRVKEYFENKLHNQAKKYSEKLQMEIQHLLNIMLTSKRKVTVTNDFFVRVIDSYDDESKSEGQFAVVSFAYIGGIFGLLKDEMNGLIKEYPLILDGPFSKLDPDQRKNVIDTIPKYAPQIVLFSKDNLEGMFSNDVLGRVWTIVSNDEKNVAEVKEGYLW